MSGVYVCVGESEREREYVCTYIIQIDTLANKHPAAERSMRERENFRLDLNSLFFSQASAKEGAKDLHIVHRNLHVALLLTRTRKS